LGAQAFFIAVTFLVAFRVARRAEERAVVLGTLVGLVAAFVDRTTASVIGSPLTLGDAASYLCLGLAGGYFGGLAGRSTLSGGVYRVSRRIGTARDAAAVAAAIGENLGDARVEGVALWRRDSAGDQAPSTNGCPGPQTLLWGS
jgi:hypothetical protein